MWGNKMLREYTQGNKTAKAVNKANFREKGESCLSHVIFDCSQCISVHVYNIIDMIAKFFFESNRIKQGKNYKGLSDSASKLQRDKLKQN